MERLYLDYNATTPLHPKVREAIVEVLGDLPGNPSSLHSFGRRARGIVEDAREALGQYLGCDPLSLYFTSGGTESNNLIIEGLHGSDRGLWVSASEHPSVMEPARRRWKQRCTGEPLGLDNEGKLVHGALGSAVSEGDLVSVHWVNNETGVIHDVASLTRAVHERGSVFHTDGAQAFFRLPACIDALDIDAATITAHKSFGPLGVGCLYVRKGLLLDPLMAGGPQERKVRPGTENLAMIHGMGALAKVAASEPLWPIDELRPRWISFRERLAAIPGVRIITPASGVFPNTVNLVCLDLDAETVLVRLDMVGIAASSGSACSSGAREPSRVLKAMGVPDREIQGAIRFSFGPQTTEEQLLSAAERLEKIVEELHRRRTTSEV